MTRLFRFLRARPVGMLFLLCVLACGSCGTGVVASQDAVSAVKVTPGMTSFPPAGTGTFVAVAQGAFATGEQALSAGVVWTASAGSITSAGLYTAPTQLGSYQVQADYAGKTGLAIANVVAPGTPGALYAAASSSCANMPLRSTGTIRYFCDCAAGSQAGCVAGSDANPGTSASAPKQTWSAAITAFNAMNAGDTIALCKGGAWALASTSTPNYCSFGVGNSRCTAGASLTDPANTSTCDIRDYSPSWGGTAKPALAGSGNLAWITRQAGSTNGVRILNLAFQGSNNGPNGGVYNDQRALLLGVCGSPISDSSWLVCGNTFDRMRLAIQGPQSGTASNVRVTGNRFTMNDLDAILGFGNGSNNSIDANFFDNNGGFPHPVTGNQAHTVYLTPLSNTGVGVATGTSIVNNEFRRSNAGGTPGACATGVIVSHGQYNGLNIENNIIDTATSSLGGCEGISFSAAGSDNTYFRNMTVRRNLVTLGSGVAITIGQAPGLAIENNIVVLTGTSDTWKQGIWSPRDGARAGLDDVQNNTRIANNTLYMTGTSLAGQYGVHAGAEGIGHIIANNSVYSVTGACFSTPLGTCSVGGTVCMVRNNIGDANVPACSGTCNPNASAYAAVTTNACYGGASAFYANSPGSDFDPGPGVTGNPLFTNPPTDLTLAAGSPLIGAGSAANAPSTDFTLVKTRPNPPSIGAYEP